MWLYDSMFTEKAVYFYVWDCSTTDCNDSSFETKHTAAKANAVTVTPSLKTCFNTTGNFESIEYGNLNIGHSFLAYRSTPSL